MSLPKPFVLGTLVLATAAFAAAAPIAPLYPERTSNLLVLRDQPGVSTPIRSPREWRRRREHVLLNMQKVMGPLPGPKSRVPLNVRLEAETVTEKYVRKKLTFASAPGERVPAYLLIPRGLKGKAPAILALHQTVEIGKDEAAGLGGSPGLHYGHELAERGFVVLAPDYPTLGEHKVDVYERGYASGSMKAIWDNMRAVDLLRTLPEVDDDRIGCLGHSLGGHNTIYTGAFDERIKAMVSNCGFNAFGKYYNGNIAGWSGPRYMPRIKSDYPTPEKMPFDFHEVVAALAPRAFLAIAPVGDSNFEVSGVKEVIAAAKPVYQLFRKPERLAALHPDCAHEWPLAMREEAYRWLERWLP
ncbi:MAG: prolyl oligopeptidase family protein [Armatimonadetes bacterium]|jgi:pimeloyl-ACP methyl ester carboxylesterase|nr:prolyl oligopeptidase family protein [Armatimonadota bacterium]